MKLKINKDQVIGGLQKAAAIIPLKAASVALRSIWLKAEEDSISIMATDANLEFTGTYPAEVEEPGLVGVHGRAFADLVGRWPSGDIHLKSDETSGTLLLEQGRRNYRLPISTSEWFQPFSLWPTEHTVLWSGDAFKDLIDHVYFCIADDDSRDAMTCLYFNPVGNGKIDVCGLNGHQFARSSFLNEDLAELFSPKGLLIQKKYLNDLKKWLGDREIELNLTEKRLFLRQFDGSEMLAIPRFTRGDYPDYNLFLGKLEGELAGNLAVPKQAAIDAMGRIMVFMSEANRCVYLQLSPTEVTLRAQGTDNGSGNESLEAAYSGKLDTIAFPNKELLEIFGHFSSAILDMMFSAQEGPCGIKGPEDLNYIVVIMPMRMPSLDEGGQA